MFKRSLISGVSHSLVHFMGDRLFIELFSISPVIYDTMRSVESDTSGSFRKSSINIGLPKEMSFELAYFTPSRLGR